MKCISILFFYLLVSLIPSHEVIAGTQDFSAAWDSVASRIDLRQYTAADSFVVDILDRAQATNQQEHWARALVARVRLKNGLNAPETAVRELREADWPEDATWRGVVELYYAQALVAYQKRYSHEIRSREIVADSDADTISVDLKAWTNERLSREINGAFAHVWVGRDEWSQQSVGKWSLFIEQNNYPARIRGTLRDAVSYLWVEQLAHTGLWLPGQQQNINHLDLELLLSGDPAGGTGRDLADPHWHPLQKISHILTELRDWHLEHDNPEAALEAELENLRRQRRRAAQQDWDYIGHYLATRLSDFDSAYPWWAMGQWQLAKFLRQEDEADSLAKAHLAAMQGVRRHRDQLGGQLCADLVRDLESKWYGLQAMSHDAAEKRTVQITHQNLEQLFFQAWKFDLPAHLAAGGNSHPDRRTIDALLDDTEPDLRWAVDLPPTEDYRRHHTYTGMPACEPGAYLVAASLRRDFDEDGNLITGLIVIVSDLVVTAQDLDGQVEYLTRSGRSGQPIGRVDLTVYNHWDSNRKPPLAPVHLRTDTSGRVQVAFSERQRVVVLARKYDDLAWIPGTRYHRRQVQGDRTENFLYTDRAIYRPGQTVHWKIVAYERNGERTEFQTLPDTNVRVSLQDPNQQEVTIQQHSTNEFGSASGSFVIPESGLLGNWRLRGNSHSSVWIKVEQYKRPTFAVRLLDPELPLQLNQKAKLTGQADYLFGAPVTTGQVKWRVTRHLDHLWSGRRGRYLPPRQSVVVATGESNLNEKGQFTLDFATRVDPRLKTQAGIFYRYAIEADVVDAGGETRSAERTYSLGFFAVQARITDNFGFLRTGQSGTLMISRTDLNQVPQAGEGQWTLHRLQQPARTLLPSQQPKDIIPGREKFAVTSGDKLNPRWQSLNAWEEDLADWQIAAIVTSGRLHHGTEGQAMVEFSDLVAGAYRLHYTTRDDAGQICEAQHEFIVAGAATDALNLPLILESEFSRLSVGDTARFLLQTGLPDQELYVQVFEGGQRTRAWFVQADNKARIIEVPVTASARQGLWVKVSAVSDHQHLVGLRAIHVPWDHMGLDVEITTFRDRVTPGSTEMITFKVGSTDGTLLNRTTTELLAYMYDRSLDAFAPHRWPQPGSVFARAANVRTIRTNLGTSQRALIRGSHRRSLRPQRLSLRPDRLWLNPRDIIRSRMGELFVRGGRSGAVSMSLSKSLAAEGTPLAPAFNVEGAEYMVEVKSAFHSSTAGPESVYKYAIDSVEEALAVQAGAMAQVVTMRENFAETAFFKPHIQIDADGRATIEYQMPDSVTKWNLWVHALTRDLHHGSASGQVVSVKDLMVRPYLPRFLREGDTADVKVVVNNTGTDALQGQVELTIEDPDSGEDLTAAFGLRDGLVDFKVEPGAGTDLVFSLQAPARVGAVTIKAVARTAGMSDGEQHALPVLPGRMHLMQSRFVSLVDVARREMHFPLMADTADATRIDEQLIVTIDAQLFGSVLRAVPYLVEYPYECVEQTLNRYLSTSILAGVFAEHPEVRAMASRMSVRETRTEAWQKSDPNRRMLLEETPWLQTANGNPSAGSLFNILDPEVTAHQRGDSLKRLAELQDPSGGFPWFPGGRPSAHLTLYVLQGFARGAEFGVTAPDAMVRAAWRYLRQHYETNLAPYFTDGHLSAPRITLLNYLMSSYDEEVWQAAGFTSDDRRLMLDFSYKNWRDHSHLLKGYLALTLLRSGRKADGRRIYESVMDAAKHDPDLGTYWAPEDRSWLWFNDSVESHAFTLRVLTELAPEDPRRKGLVQWLLLNKKLGHWKSTRATAEAIYALVHFMQQEGTLSVREEVVVQIGEHTERFVFEPDEYTGHNNQLVLSGAEIDPQSMATVIVAKETPGLAFASATWHYSTEQLPTQADGDLFAVTRRYFRRHHDGTQWVLTPLAAGEAVAVGDQVEVQLSLTVKQAAEYVHLRDPRGAGFEPESTTSGYRWRAGLGYYEEVRDSGANFFFSRLPTGQYTLKYRLRANMTGEFKVGPATLQSMYAPEFAAHSTGRMVRVRP